MVMLSAGVTTAEKDYSTYVAQVSTTVVGAVGGAVKGPVDTPMFISSPDQFLRVFGDPTPDSLATYSVLQFLQEGNKLWYIRVGSTTGDDPLAPASLEVYDDQTTSAEVMTITAKTDGTWGNEVRIYVDDISGLEFTLSVEYKGVTVESYEGSLDSASDIFIEDLVKNSDYIYVDVADDVAVTEEGEDGTISIENAHTEGTLLSGGADGLSELDSSDIIGASLNEGLQNFKNSEVYDINLMIVPAKSALASVATEMISICESRGDCMAIIDTPFGMNPEEVVSWHNGQGEGEDDPSASLNSSYATLYWSWLKIQDPYYSTERWIPPSGFIAGQYAHSDRVSKPWFAPAGLKRGRLIRALDVEYSPNQGERDLLYSGGNAINPIVNFAQDGITIWGQRTLQRKPSATDRVNVRRLLLMIRKAIAASTRYITFDPNDEFLWNEWKGFVQPYLQNLKDSRAFYDFKVEMGLGSTITNSDIDGNRMPGRVMVQPTKSAEFIPIDFVLLNTGAEFPE